jgi:hypothetical protein
MTSIGGHAPCLWAGPHIQAQATREQTDAIPNGMTMCCFRGQPSSRTIFTQSRYGYERIAGVM